MDTHCYTRYFYFLFCADKTGHLPWHSVTVLFSGNESLTSKDGYFPGSHVILNSGLGSHGGGENCGLSKALCMICMLFTIPAHYSYSVCWNLAWTPIDVLQSQIQFRPILIALCKSLDFHFWV